MNKTITAEEFCDLRLLDFSDYDREVLNEIRYTCKTCNNETELHLYISEDEKTWIANCGCCGTFNVTAIDEVHEMVGFKPKHATIIILSIEMEKLNEYF